MHCPQCGSSEFDLTTLCPDCEFSANGRLLERLSNLNYIISEIESWDTWILTDTIATRLTERYQKRRRAVNVELGLRPPPPDVAETHDLRLQLDKREYLQEKLSFWARRKWVSYAVQSELTAVINKEIAEIKDRLMDAPTINLPASLTSLAKRALRRWELVQYVKETLTQLCEDGQMVDHACKSAMAQLDAEIEQLELAAGIRQPEPLPEEVVADLVEEPEIEAEAKVKLPPRRKRDPFSWDKVWESLLSERTLHAILFLGVVLLFASGVSWVVWNWGTFPPIVQIAVLGSYTTFFYGLGWYVRVKMNLRGSGIALSAVGALLLPLDFYAFYLSGGFPADSWPFVWLLASAACLIIYVLTAVSIQAAFFGYLVSVATSSLFAAAANVMGFAFHWQLVAIGTSALVQAVLSDGLRRREGKLRILAVPFGQMALVTAVPIMAVTLIWGFFDGTADFWFQLARAASWTVGSITLLLMTRHYRLRPFVLATALAIPIALWLMQGSFFTAWHTDAGWHAPGWAILAALYFAVAHRLPHKTDDFDIFKPIILAVGWLLIGLSALWGLMDAPAAAVTYLFLAGLMLFLARLWHDARLLWLMSLFLLLGSGNWMAWREASLAELALPWSLLAILHIIAALRVERHFASRNLSLSKAKAEAGKANRRYTNIFAVPLFGSAILIAFVALLPPAILFDRQLLIYALGNWIGISGWMAYLVHKQETPALEALLSHRRLRPIAPALFHWLTALPLVGWVWLVWDSNGYVYHPPVALLYALLAWLLLALCLRLRRARWVYGRPWQTAAHLSNLIALAILFEYGRQPEQPWKTAVLYSITVFYFLSVFLLHNNRWFYIGGITLPLAVVASGDYLHIDDMLYFPVIAFIPLAYITAVMWLENQRNKSPDFTRPLIRVLFFLSAIVIFIVTASVVLDFIYSIAEQLSLAIASLLIAVTTALYAWQRDKSEWAHIAIWLATAAFGIIGAAYSSGSGRSAIFAALLAIIYVLTERGLHQLARTKHALPSVRRAWLFFKRPLLYAGWAVSVITIGMALVRNLVSLGGGTTREIWAAIALTLIVGLYALSARLFRNAEFVWIASMLAFAPWSIAAHLIFWVTDEWFSIAWAAFALALMAVGIKLAQRFGLRGESGRWSWPSLVIAHAVMPFALFWLLLFLNISPAVTTIPLAIIFYLIAAWIDRHFRQKGEIANARFLYPMTLLMPVWAVSLLLEFAPRSPNPTLVPIGLLVLAFALPMLLVGKRLSKWEAGYGMPFYLTAYGTAIIAIPLVLTNLPVFAGVLFFNSGIALLSVLLFRQPLWFYPATVLLPTAVSVVLIHNNADPYHYGWAFVSLAAVYLAAARLLRHFSLRRYEMPLLVMMFVLIISGLPFSSFDREGALVGYSIAMGTLTFAAVWLRKPLIFSFAVALLSVPYWTAVSLLNVDFDNAGLAAWPLILFAIVLGRWLDQLWGREPIDGKKQPITRFPWHNPLVWPTAFWRRWTGWWAFSLYTLALWYTAVSALLSIESAWRWTLVLALGTAVYTWATFRFRSKIWMLVAGAWAQFTALALIRLTWAGWADEPAWLALAFMPVTMLTLAAALAIERVQEERALLTNRNGRLSLNLGGWALPFYLLFFTDIFFGQLMTFANSGASTPVTLLHGAMVGVLATAWYLPLLTYIGMALGAVAMAQMLQFWNAPPTDFPPALAVLATAYGAVGYALQRRRLKKSMETIWTMIWERPLIHSGWLLSFITVALLFILATSLPQVTFWAVFWGRKFTLSDSLQAMMAIRTFAILGLFYLAAALVENRPRLSYVALMMLFTAWSLWLLLIQNARELQLYALPAGLYLLAVGWMEWKYGRRGIARWIDIAAVLLLLGSTFWQSFGEHGEWYALLMIIEGLLIGWLGSLRRLRRLLYAGVAGVVTAVIGQLIEPLFALNTFALLILGAALVALGIGLERRLEAVRELSKEFRLKLDEWE